MKFELDDNARSGFHYLLLGIGVIGAAVLVDHLLDRAHVPIGPADAFGHGYLVDGDGSSLIAATTSRGERIAAALLLAFTAGIAAGVLFSAVARAIGQRSRGITAGWIVLACVLAWCCSVALFRPPSRFVGTRDGNLILWHRPVLFHDITLPGGRTIELIPFADIARISFAEVPSVRGACGTWTITCALKNGGSRLLGRSAAVCSEDVAAFAQERAAQLNAQVLAR